MTEQRSMTGKERDVQGGPERTRGGAHFIPRVDICETDKELLLFADMPGVRPDSVDLNYERGELHLHGRVPDRARGRLLYAEYEEGDYHRSFAIHESIDHSKIEASCKNGVLTVRLPKAAGAQPRQIKVRAE
jgi:HSP20 family molecular chaperone IbpA